MAATFPTTISTNGNHKLVDISDAPSGAVSIKQIGTGTWTLKFSPDGGTTFIDLTDVSGNTFTGTTSGLTRYALGKGSNNYKGALYLNVANASGLDITADVIAD